MHTKLSKVIVLSILALGMGFTAPASAKNSRHPAASAYASDEHGNAANPGEVRGGRVPEPIYMYIQTRDWAESN